MPRLNIGRNAEELLSYADVKIGGNRPWDIHVHNPRFFVKALTHGSLGLGESYMAKWWDSPRLDKFFYKILRAELESKVTKTTTDLIHTCKAKLINLQKISRAFQVGQRHYDIGNNLYRRMLDKNLIYSCGYWKEAVTLDEAQEAKLDLLCRKLHLQPGMRVLDIGCGWGGAARFIAQRFKNVKVLGITVSKEQARFAREFCRGLAVEIRLQDYRTLEGEFDRIFSLGMFEHVGYKNYRTYMQAVRRCLQDDGLFLLHTIGGNRSVFTIDPWIEKYIFPNAMLPSKGQICQAVEGLFVMEDWHNFGAGYDKTLMEWFNNFDENWDELKNDYNDQFYRMWKYYLLSCAGSFRARKNQVWQIVFSPKGVPGGHQAQR